MRQTQKIAALLLVVVFLLSGCSLLTMEELYCPPKRSEDYDNLQSVIDKAMNNLAYSAPVSGENRQAVQTADLDGDGVDEYLLFAQDNSEMPLKILIFCQIASGYVLMETIEGFGFAFDFVTYAQMDDRDGVEIIVGRRVSDELTHSVSVYRFTSGFAQQLLNVGCAELAVEDFDGDKLAELLLLNAGESERSNGTIMLFDYEDGQMSRSAVDEISLPINALMRLDVGTLSDGTTGVFVTSAQSDTGLTVDVFSAEAGFITALHRGIWIPAIRNYCIYPLDIDNDSILELAEPVELMPLTEESKQQYILQWYALESNGTKIFKTYTYHSFADEWYLVLDEQWACELIVEQTEAGYAFYIRNEISGEVAKVFFMYTLTGSDREAQAALEGRTVIYKAESIIFAVELEEIAADYGITGSSLKRNFRPIRMEWSTDESEDKK